MGRMALIHRTGEHMSGMAKPIVVLIMAIMAMPLLISPPEASMTTDNIFDDQALERVKTESNDRTTSEQLLVRISHDDGGPLTGNFSRVNQLLSIENSINNEESSAFKLNHNEVYLKRLESPVSAWESAFLTRNESITESSSWGEVLQPLNDDGWCSDCLLYTSDAADD